MTEKHAVSSHFASLPNNMEAKHITEQAGEYVFEFLKEKLSPDFTFHTFGHTLDVVEAAREIGKGTELSEEEMEVVELASWFHDVGYVIDRTNHEDEGWKLAKAFLESHQYPEDRAQRVHDCIQATRLHHTPQNKLENVIRDADMSHLGSKNHVNKSLLLRQELEKICDMTFTDREWIEKDIEFLLRHTYGTFYAQRHFHAQKVENVLTLQKRLKKLEEKKAKKKSKKVELELKQQALDLKSSKYNTNDRGVQTMFRVILRNHIDLSSIADNKANIMLSINAIIISILVSSVGPKLDKNEHLVIPFVLMLLTNIVTILYAVKSTRPKITAGKFTQQDIENKSANLLFFGNFHNMRLEDFELGFNQMINDKDFLYDSLTRDFYHLGQVLGKKYRYLSFCYAIFAVGLVISVIATLASVLLLMYYYP